MRRFLAPFLAVLMALSSIGVAAAANQTSTAAETLTVLSTTTLTGVPATLSYGSGASGRLAAPVMSIAVTSNNPTGVSLAIGAATTAFTSGSNTISRTARSFVATVPGGSTCALDTGANYWSEPNGNPMPATGGLTICQTSTVTSALNVDLTPRVTVPGATPAGTYTGSLVISVTEKP